jgi:hypothetical protein
LVDEPLVEEPVVEEPLVDEPLVEEPVVDQPLVDEPLVEEPVVDQPLVEEPLVDEPLVEEPVVDQPVADEPVVDEPPINEPPVEEPLVDEPLVEEPVVEEPVVDEPVVDEPLVEEPVVEEPVVDEPLVEEPVVGEPPVKEQSTGQSPNSGPLPLLVSQHMQISPTQLLSLTGTELAGLGLNIIGLPSESLTNLSAAQVAALTNVQISALSLRMISLPYVESSIGNSSFWPEPLNLQEIRTLDPNPIVSIQSLGVPTVNAPLYSLTAQSIFNRLNLETPTSVIEVVPQIIDKMLMPGNLLYQLVKTGSENAGLDEFLHHHLAPEALGLVVARFRHAAENAKHQRNRMFADRIGIAALSTGQPDTRRTHHIAVILIRPGAGGLDKAQAGGKLGQIIPPQPGTDQHVSARNPRIQIIAVAHFEAAVGILG